MKETPEEFLENIPGEIPGGSSWREKKCLVDINGGIPGGNPVRRIGGTSVEFLGKLLSEGFPEEIAGRGINMVKKQQRWNVVPVFAYLKSVGT